MTAPARTAPATVDWLLLGGALVVVLAAVLLDPRAEAVAIFGFDVPVLCGVRNLTGLPCPGCGLTRSFSFMAHGLVVEAFQMNLMGPPMFTVVALQLPYRAVRLGRRWWAARQTRASSGS